MRLYLLACEVFRRELERAATSSPHRVEAVFAPKDLHDRGGRAMGAELQRLVDAAPSGIDAVVLGWALCSNGLVGLRARSVPLVAFRAHDCIACLLGSRTRYDDEFRAEPGTYWLSAGWLEHARPGTDPIFAAGPPDPADPRWLELVTRHGEDNARFLWDELRDQAARYRRLAWIGTGVGDQERLLAEAARRAAARGWRFEAFAGDRAWIDALVGGGWDAGRFLVVPPGHRVEARHDGSLMAAVP